jgi:hypothetical protein
MKRTAINFFGKIIYSKKIKNYENKYAEIQVEDWSNNPWEDYAKDCFKAESESKELISNSTGSKRIEFICGLQALYNSREKELDFVEEKIQNMPISEFKYFFDSEYKSILTKIKEQDIGTALNLYVEYGKIVNSNEIQKNYKWKHVSATLVIFAIEEVFGNALNNIETNIRNL